MRAVARGLTERGLLSCPRQCGGPGADLETLPLDVQALRARHGCDSPIPIEFRRHYAVRCPRCDGSAASGAPCEKCAGTSTPGFLHVDRCPASLMTPDIAEATRALSYLRLGILPGPGSLGDQTISFTEFRTIFEHEMTEAQADAEQD